MESSLMRRRAPKTLVLFYSLTGTTRTVATELARQLNADLEEIRCARYAPNPFGALRAAYDSVRGRLPPTEPRSHPLSHYDLVVIGGPVWASHVASPIRSLLREETGRWPSLACFVTHGGSPLDAVFRELQQLTGVTTLRTLGLRQADVKAGRFDQQVAAFAASLQAGCVLTRPNVNDEKTSNCIREAV